MRGGRERKHKDENMGSLLPKEGAYHLMWEVDMYTNNRKHSLTEV